MKPFRVACPHCEQRLTANKPELVGKKVKCPKCKTPFVIQKPKPKVAPENTLPNLDIPSEDRSPVPKRSKNRRKTAGRLNLVIGVVTVLLAAGTVGWYVKTQFASTTLSQTSTTPPTQKATNSVTQTSAVPSNQASSTKPSSKPFDFSFVPPGTRLVAHWQPRKLKQAGRTKGELWKCGGGFTTILDSQVEKLCAANSNELEQVTLYLIPGPKGKAPFIVTKCKLAESVDQQAWTARIPQPSPKQAPEKQDQFQIYTKGKRQFFWIDEETFLSAPNELTQEAIDTATSPLPTTPGLDKLIKQSDQHAEVAVLVDLAAFKQSLPDLLQAENDSILSAIIDWFGLDSKAVLWKIDLDETQLHSEFVVQAAPFTSDNKLANYWSQNLNESGKRSWEEMRRSPRSSSGSEAILARLPAMLQLSSRATSVSIENQQIQLTTQLSERAAPNLMLATWMFWKESKRTHLVPTGKTPAVTHAKTLVERLNTDVFIDFRLTPLQEAIELIGSESGINIQIAGDALKNEGYTQNMPQNYNLGKVPAKQALKHLLDQYPKMVLVLDEKQKQAIVTTRSFAEMNNQTPHEFK